MEMYIEYFAEITTLAMPVHIAVVNTFQLDTSNSIGHIQSVKPQLEKVNVVVLQNIKCSCRYVHTGANHFIC